MILHELGYDLLSRVSQGKQEGEGDHTGRGYQRSASRCFTGEDFNDGPTGHRLNRILHEGIDIHGRPDQSYTQCALGVSLKGSSLNPPLAYWQINWGFDLWCRSRQKVAFLRSLLEPFTNTRSGIRCIGIPSAKVTCDANRYIYIFQTKRKLYMTYSFEPWGWTMRVRVWRV